MPIFKRLFHHCKMKITETSNVIQFDDLGYPLMLCITKCPICGRSKQEWYDISAQYYTKMKDELVECKWKKV